MRTSRTIATLTVALAFTAGACSSSNDDGEAGSSSTDAVVDAPETAEVTIARSRFGPDEVTLAAGGTVTFTNTDPFAHTVTADPDVDPAFGSGLLDPDETFDVTFETAGTFAYFCEVHPTMRATVVVS
jgi:plastocyanin